MPKTHNRFYFLPTLLYTGCSIANSYISVGFGGLKCASWIWFEGGFGILSGGFFAYDPLIW